MNCANTYNNCKMICIGKQKRWIIKVIVVITIHMFQNENKIQNPKPKPKTRTEITTKTPQYIRIANNWVVEREGKRESERERTIHIEFNIWAGESSKFGFKQEIAYKTRQADAHRSNLKSKKDEIKMIQQQYQATQKKTKRLRKWNNNIFFFFFLPSNENIFIDVTLQILNSMAFSSSDIRHLSFSVHSCNHSVTRFCGCSFFFLIVSQNFYDFSFILL